MLKLAFGALLQQSGVKALRRCIVITRYFSLQYSNTSCVSISWKMDESCCFHKNKPDHTTGEIMWKWSSHYLIALVELLVGAVKWICSVLAWRFKSAHRMCKVAFTALWGGGVGSPSIDFTRTSRASRKWAPLSADVSEKTDKQTRLRVGDIISLWARHAGAPSTDERRATFWCKLSAHSVPTLGECTSKHRNVCSGLPWNGCDVGNDSTLTVRVNSLVLKQQRPIQKLTL